MEAHVATILDQLFQMVTSRRDADPATSYTAQLLSRGAEHVAKKLGEEALETARPGLPRHRSAPCSEPPL